LLASSADAAFGYVSDASTVGFGKFWPVKHASFPRRFFFFMSALGIVFVHIEVI